MADACRRKKATTCTMDVSFGFRGDDACVDDVLFDPIHGRSRVQPRRVGAVRTDGNGACSLATIAWSFPTKETHRRRWHPFPCHVDDSNPHALVRRRRLSSSRGMMRSVRTSPPFGSFLSTMTSVDVWPRVWTNQHPALSIHPVFVQGSLSFPSHPPNPAGSNPGGAGTVCVPERGGDASCSTPPEGSNPIPSNQEEITTSVVQHTVHTTPWRVQEDGGWSPRCVP